MSPRRFVFNPPAATIFTGDAATRYLQSNAPSLILEETFEHQAAHTRHEAQLRGLPPGGLAGAPGPASELFGDDLSRFCRAYVVRRLWVDDEHEREAPDDGPAPLGNAPPRAVGARPPAAERLMQALGSPRGAARPGDEVLYLFHVIVALEWVPTPGRLRRLQWAFRRASDYLYDVSNGGMAFGQVTFAGPAWMRGADVQILASNRFLPRSWVSGLLERHKYTPIRLGRGLWVRDRRVVVDWDEPEGYRAIVHEWAHYALGLKDEYMAVRRLALDPAGGVLTTEGAPDAPHLAVVLPNRRVKSESIMASVQGNSELANPLAGEQGATGNLARVLRERYPHLGERLRREWSGPGMLPLPLPHFRLAGELAEGAAPTERTIAVPCAYAGGAPAGPGPSVPLDEDAIPTGRWELFVARLEGGRPARLVYQGELDARAPEQGFTLLGAEPGDSALLLSSAGPLQVWARALGPTGDEAEGRLARRQWQLLQTGPEATAFLLGEGAEAPAAEAAQPWAPAPAGAAAPPDVLPVTPPHEAGAPPQKTRAMVRLRADGAPEAVHTVFGIGDAAGAPATAEAGVYSLPSLDGYVVTTAGAAGAAGWPALTIGDFSQGGPPGTAPSMVSDPIAAGAASGEALILCDVRDPAAPTEAYRVVTTALRGAPLPAGAQALSPVFSVAANLPLLASFTPTLLIVNAFGGDPGAARICRVDGDTLTPLPTYVAADGAYAVAPLLPGASALVVAADAPPAPGEPISERFVLARV